MRYGARMRRRILELLRGVGPVQGAELLRWLVRQDHGARVQRIKPRALRHHHIPRFHQIQAAERLRTKCGAISCKRSMAPMRVMSRSGTFWAQKKRPTLSRIGRVSCLTRISRGDWI